MEDNKIYASDLSALGPIMQTIFREQHPNGMTREELEAVALEHNWARRVLYCVDAAKQSEE